MWSSPILKQTTYHTALFALCIASVCAQDAVTLPQLTLAPRVLQANATGQNCASVGTRESAIKK